MGLCDKLIAYESGELSEQKTLELFAELVKSGQAWTLQGHYGRMATILIDNGYLDTSGKVLRNFK